MGIASSHSSSDPPPRPLIWLGSTRKDLIDLPPKVVHTFGYALYLAQTDRRHLDAKPLAGFGDAAILEVIEHDQGGTYRAVYTVRFEAAIFVLHVFQKKSKRGRELPKPDAELIERRLKQAAQIAEAQASEKAETQVNGTARNR